VKLAIECQRLLAVDYTGSDGLSVTLVVSREQLKDIIQEATLLLREPE
jgi:hypothetical protein